MHHSNFGTFPSHKKCPAQPSNIYNNQKTFKYIKSVILQQKSLPKKPRNKTIKSTEAPPQNLKRKAESHIFPVGPTSRFHCWDRFRLRTRLYLCHGVFSRVFGFIMAVIIVGGKKGSNRLRFGGAIFQILLLLRPEAGKLRSYSTKMK